METILNQNEDTISEQCSACDSVPGEAKATCRQALGCL